METRKWLCIAVLLCVALLLVLVFIRNADADMTSAQFVSETPVPPRRRIVQERLTGAPPRDWMHRDRVRRREDRLRIEL